MTGSVLRRLPFLLLAAPLLLTACAASHPVATSESPAARTNALAPHGAPGPELTLAAHSQTDYSIVIPAAPTPQEQKAATDLAHWLGEMTSASFPIRRAGDANPPTGPVISLGTTPNSATGAAPRDSGIDQGESYTIAVDGPNLLITGGAQRGPIPGVYALLEEDLGCRWYTPTATVIPHRPDLHFRPVPRTSRPRFQTRDPFYWEARDPDWSLHNRTNSRLAAIPPAWGDHVRFAAGLSVHTFQSLVPAAEFFKAHPDYFALVNGHRQASQLCMTSPGALAVTIQRVKAALKSDPGAPFISVSPNDGRGYCECPTCKAINDAEGSPSGALLHFVNAVADAVAQDYPNVKVSTLAYMGTFRPPRNIRPRPNVVIQLCTDAHAFREPFLPVTATPEFQDAMRGWQALGARTSIWDYTVDFHHYLTVMPNMPVVAQNIRFYAGHGAEGVMLEGDYQSPGAADAALRCWVWSKLLWDPTRDTRALIRDFVAGYYGQAAAPMQDYQDLLWRFWEQEHEAGLRHIGGGMNFSPLQPVFSHAFLTQAWECLTLAEHSAGDAETLRRVELAELPVIYVELCRMLPEINTPTGRGDGPRFRTLTERFARIARREQITHIAEGPATLDDWVASLRRKVSNNGRQMQDWATPTDRGPVRVLELPAVWSFATDGKDTGVSDGWFAPRFEDTGWAEQRSDLKLTWDCQGYPGFIGTAWYRQHVALPADLPKEHVYLYFAAVDEDSFVYVNGRLVCDHSRAATGLTAEQVGSTPFMADITNDLKPGEKATLAVRVKTSVEPGGMWKPVYIVAADRALDLAAMGVAIKR